MGVQQRRKNPLPVVRAAHGHGIFLLEHGEPHDPCPVEGLCGGTAVRASVRSVVCGLQCAAAAARPAVTLGRR